MVALNDWSEQRSTQSNMNLSPMVEDSADQKVGRKAKSNTKGFGSKS